MEKLLNNRYAILVVGVVTMLMYGIIYAWSIFIPPLEAEFGWSRASTSLVFSVAMIALSVGMTCVGQLAKHMPLRRVFLLGGLLVVAGLVCCRFVTQPWHLYLLYGVLCGFGVGLAYTSWTTSVLAWFGDRAGFASGFLVMGFGMGTVVLGAVATLLIYSALGWRWAFTIIGASVFAWSLLACAFMRTPPPKVAALRSKRSDTGLSLAGKQVASSSSFWIFCAWRSFFMGSVAAIIAEASVMMTGIGASVAFATTAVAALGLGNGLGRPLGGIVYDRLGQAKTMVLLPALGLAVSVATLPCYLAHLPAAFAALVLAAGLVYGMYSAINTSFMRTTYGQANLATNTGISALVLAPFNLIFPVLAAAIFDGSGSYDAYFAIIPACALVSLCCGIAIKPAIARLQRRYGAESKDEDGNMPG